MGIFDFIKKTTEKEDTIKSHLESIPRMEKEQYLLYLNKHALCGFREGKAAYADELQKVFLFSDVQHDQSEVARAFLEKLQNITVKQLIIFSEESRGSIYGIYGEGHYYNYSWKRWRMSMKNTCHTRDSFPHLSDEQYVAMLCMGTFHSNGFYRQMCLYALAECNIGIPMKQYEMIMSPLPFYLLRVNDWVSEIRKTAKTLAINEICQCDVANLLLVMPILEKVRNSHRREQNQLEEIEEAVKEKLKTRLPNSDLSVLISYDVNIRNVIYVFFLQNQVLSHEQMDWMLQREKTGYGKRILFSGIIRFYGSDSFEIDKYLEDKNIEIRYCALNYKYNKVRTSWDGLDKMLLDESAKIRELVSFILRRYDNFEVLKFYQDSLKEAEQRWKEASGNESKIRYRRICKGALLGIGENGSKNDISLLERYMKHSDSGIVRAAMQAYGLIMREQGSELYWNFLVGDMLEYAITAYKLINKYKITYDSKKLYDTYISKKNSAASNMFLNLLLRAPSWDRLEYLIELYDASDISEHMLNAVKEGCNRRAMYGSMSVAKVERLKAVLERKKEVLPESLINEIIFDLKYVSQI